MAAEKKVLDLSATIAEADYEHYSAAVAELQELCLGPDGGRFEELDVLVAGRREKMPAGRALANLVFLYPYRLAGAAPGPDRFIRAPLDAGAAEQHMDRTIAELYEFVDPEALSRAASSAFSVLSDVASSLVGRVGTSVSIKSLLEAAEADPRIGELLNWSCPEGDLKEIEEASDAAGAELVERLQATDGEWGRLLRCGAAVNKDQLRQTVVTVGLKPGLQDGDLIPEPVDTSFLRGMRGAQDMYIVAISARKALTTNHRQVKNSGYLARKLVLLACGHSIDPDLEDCGTLHGVATTIACEDHARRLEGRYLCFEGDDQTLMYSAESLRGRVGEAAILRSPITCAGPNGVCHACYGLLARSNMEIHAGVYGTLVISEQITQRLLSSKHLLKARPTEFVFPQEFTEAFTVERASVIPESAVEKIEIMKLDLEEGEDEEEPRQTTARFRYKLHGTKKWVEVTTPTPVYLDEDAWEGVEEYDGKLSISPVPELPVFHVPVTNTDLSEALNAIAHLIQSEDLPDYDYAYNRLIELLTKSKIATPSVHAEMILRALVRDPSDLMRRPDFSQMDPPPAVMLRLPAAILNSPSVTNSLAFERIKQQLTSMDILKKTEPGVLDPLFGG